MDQQTATRRIMMEVSKENLEDITLATISLIKAIAYYVPHRFFFNEKVGFADLITGQGVYKRQDLWPGLERIDSLWILKNHRWEWICPLHSDEFTGQLSPDTAGNNLPRVWSWYEDSLHLDPAPDQDYETKTLGIRKTDVPSAAWDGTAWVFSKSSGSAWLPDDTCEFLTHAPELAIARAKWDLYFNVYDDNDNAQKMQNLVDIEYARLAKRLTNLKANVHRIPTSV